MRDRESVYERQREAYERQRVCVRETESMTGKAACESLTRLTRLLLHALTRLTRLLLHACCVRVRLASATIATSACGLKLLVCEALSY
jgi:hypothetical protein